MKRVHNHPVVLTAIHTAVIHIWTILSTAFFGVVAILFSFFSKTGNSVHGVARIWARSILWISGIRVDVKGELIPHASDSFIYMSNHQSNFDIPVLLSHLKAQFRWLAKAELFRIPIFGTSMKGAGYISIDRTNRKSAFQSLARAAKLIRNGTSVLIFPEGTRSGDGELQPFKKGGFVLAVDAGVPIIPVIIKGTYNIMPKNRLMIQRHPVILEILPPIDTTGYSRKTKDELMAKVRQSMAAAGSGGHPGENDA